MHQEKLGDEHSSPHGSSKCTKILSNLLSISSLVADKYFSRGGGEFYRQLVVDEERNVLYVGGMNRLYKLWLFNLNDTSSDAFVSCPCL